MHWTLYVQKGKIAATKACSYLTSTVNSWAQKNFRTTGERTAQQFADKLEQLAQQRDAQSERESNASDRDRDAQGVQ